MRNYYWVLSLLVLSATGCGQEEPVPAAVADSPVEESEKVAAPPKAEQKAAVATQHRPLSRAEITEGWIQLFDGESLFGWKATNDVNWSVENGEIVATAGEPGWLNTTTQFADYELRCECWVEKGGNSGLFLRAPLEPQDPAVDCYEFNLCDTHAEFATASLVTRQQPAQRVVNDGEWVAYHITVGGNQIIAKVDGKTVLDFTDESPDRPVTGYIGLQFREGTVKFRNIALKPLGTSPIFNGTDLTGWRVVEGGKSTFEVQEGAIHVSDGRGYLESESTWDDFVLQAEIISNGEHLNSGIFFRALPAPSADQMNGYEAQVRNEWKGDDRNQPVDFGTGGIYRRVPTRRVISSDHEWFTMTVIAQAAHVAVWVDGFPVTDWTDERAPAENPREGLRTAAGHFSIQGHDPTTDLSFRKLRVAKLPPPRIKETP
ncbi:DUF1080 domain-containing protein [Symmachiella dynata]|uniref:3-keto-disaccharide hydrolase n=1 Tax=Symmachiella dynata TaxID=2527995 RepID=UPI0030EF93B1